MRRLSASRFATIQNMHNEHINLLPYSRQKQLRQDYWVRFTMVVIVVVTWLVVIAGVLLIPSYVFLNMDKAIKQEDLKNRENTLASSDEKELLAQLQALGEQAASLKGLQSTPSVVQTMALILAASHEELSLVGFVYMPAVGKAPRSITISGVADSRDALRRYQVALKAVPGVSSAELPVSAYTKDAAIPFTITVAFLP
jgi:Tfp pilus assembly protein PilN